MIIASATIADDCTTVFAGEIPNFSKCVALEKLDLSWNNLSGKPTMIARHHTKLWILGTIPDFSSNVALKFLNLGTNALTGKPTANYDHQLS